MNIVHFMSKPPWGGAFWNIALEKRFEDKKFLEKYGYKVYSQNDEDGILYEIFRRIGVKDKNFVEFGVDKGIESNTHALLLQGWSGLWIEGRYESYRQILRRFAPILDCGKLKVLNQYVNRDNIDKILKQYGYDCGLDLLSIDVDGNDWHIWNAISREVLPRVVVIEYNGKFTPEINWKMAYNEDHSWDGTDMQGASLKALEILGNNKGYQLVGTNICGINAFFVRKDLAKDLFPIPATAENLYNPARMNMLRHHNGHLARNYVGNDIEGMSGVFRYYPDWNWMAGAGFYRFEIKDGIRRSLMQERKARFFVRWIPDNSRVIRFHYEISLDVNLLGIKGLSGSIKIGETEHTFRVTDRVGTIDVPFGEKNGLDFDGIFAVDIEVERLWVPEHYIRNGDFREQGLAVLGVEYLTG